MQKKRVLTLLLCLSLLLSSFAVPVRAEETPAALGSITVTNGCKTMEAMSPLGGSHRILETAQAAFVYERSTDTVVYSYNADLKLYPGSLSKMLTALIAIERCDLDEEVTVSTREISQLPVGSITARLKEGEIVTVEDLLYCLILTSANDAALVLAEHIAGNEAGFVEIMNQRAAELGCTNSHFTNCHGLDDAGQYTTARDMARITSYASANPTFATIFSSNTYTLKATNKVSEDRKLETGNHLRYDLVLRQFNDSRVTGGMPSYVSPASGASIAFTAEDKGMDLVFVILGTTRTYNSYGNADYYGNFNEALDLLEFTFSGYKINRILYSGQAFHQFEVNDGECEVVGTPNVNVDTVLPIDANMSNLIIKYSVVDGGIVAPVETGDKIATVQLWYSASCIAEVELFAMNPVLDADETGVEIFGPTRDDSNVAGFLSFVVWVFIIAIVGFGGYMGYNYYRYSRARNRRRRNSAQRRRR